MRTTFTLLILLFSASLSLAQYSWTQRADASTTPRGHAVAFSIAGKGYVCTGLNNGILLNDLWEYDPVNDTWTQKASFPGSSRYDAVAFVINDIAYVGMGWNGGPSNGYKDFFAYDPVANSWSPKATYPGLGARNAAATAVGGKGYVGGGHIGTTFPYRDDFYEYDPVNDTWTAKTSFPFGGRAGAVALSIGDFAYFYGGQDGAISYTDLWRFDPTTNNWASMPSKPGLPVMQGVAFPLNDKAYFGLGHPRTGGSIPTDTIFEFDPVNSAWSMIPIYPPGDRSVPISFSIGNKAFVGTGRDANGTHMIEFYEYSDLEAVGLEPEAPSHSLFAYPNPTTDRLNFKLNRVQAEDIRIELFDVRGRKLISHEIGAGQDQLQLSLKDLPDGTYFYTARVPGQQAVMGKVLLMK